MSFKDTYWSTAEVAQLYNAENPEQAIIQPIIVRQVAELNPVHILDYGCGDAYMAKILPDSIKIDLYDRNQQSLEKVFRNLHNKNCKWLHNEDEFPDNFYDCIVLSFVLVCIDNMEDQYRILRKLRLALKTEGGTLIITNSHPCFLQYSFTAFSTGFDPDRFNYFNNGQPYEVSIHQPDGHPTVTFTDYQWQLSVWMNAAIDCGFSLDEMIEVPDQTYKNLTGNKLYPPFLILKFK